MVSNNNDIRHPWFTPGFNGNTSRVSHLSQLLLNKATYSIPNLHLLISSVLRLFLISLGQEP